jgi:mono/diheme cytochrome c family protein
VLDFDQHATVRRFDGKQSMISIITGNCGWVGKEHRSMKSLLYFPVFGALIFGGTILTTASAAVAKDGEAVYAAKCKNCHGADGAGNPAIAKMMNVTMKALGSAEVQAKSDADLKMFITAGVGKMKPVVGLAAADVDNVVAYVRTLKK